MAFIQPSTKLALTNPLPQPLPSWLPWRLVAAAVCPVPVFLGVSLLLLWDSPQFYLTSTRPDKAAAALAFYRGNHWPDADKEMKQMKVDVVLPINK